MKILLLSDNYIPEMNANARIFSEIAELWAAQEEDVTVITSHPNFPKGKIFMGYRNQLISKEVINKAKVLRVKTYMYPNKGIFRRTVDGISFGLSSFICGIFQPKFDVVIAVTPQLSCGISGCLLALLKKTPFVLVVCDLGSDSMATKGISPKKWLYRGIKKIESWMYRKACSIVVLSENFIHHISERGVPREKIILSIAGASRQFYPRAKNDAIIMHYGLSNKFVVGCIGTFGASHNHEDILDVAQFLQETGNKKINFLMLGDGIKRETLAEQARGQLHNVVIDGPFPGDLIPEYWSVADVAVIPLAPTETNKTVLPTKILEAMAMGVPIILYGPEGEARKFLARSHTGWFIPAGNKEALAKILLELSVNKQDILKDQSKVVEFARKFTRERQAQELLKHLIFMQDEVAYEKI